jgi:hypothetical protein
MGTWFLVFSAAFVGSVVGSVAAILVVNYMAPWGSDR